MEDNPDSAKPVMTSPAPETVAEQQVLRVTEPKPETTPTTSQSPRQSPRQKDPKKVDAGRAGAAARKAKQDRLLEELREAKESRRNMENTSGAPPDREVENFVASTPAKEKAEKAAPAVRTAGSTTPWIIGAAAGLGLAYWAASQRAPVDPPVLPPKKSVTPPVLSPDGSAQQLKVHRDPFHME